jgi:hypothetical protein
MSQLRHLFAFLCLFLHCIESGAQITKPTLDLQGLTPYFRVIFVEAHVTCYVSQGADDDFISTFMHEVNELLGLTLEEYLSIKKSKEYQENSATEIIDYWRHMGGCAAMWQHWKSVEKYHGQPRPPLNGNDPSKPFEF